MLLLRFLNPQATEEKLIPVMKKVLREFYGEKPEESKDYCRIGEAKLSRKEAVSL